jgi:hypothetical protein
VTADGMLEVMHNDFHRFWEIDVNLPGQRLRQLLADASS